MNSYIDRIRTKCQALQPKPTDMAAQLMTLEGVRAILFDIYGTLIISGSGDIGSNKSEHLRVSLLEVLELFGLKLKCDPHETEGKFQEAVKREHERAKQAGIAFPEVDYREVWAAILPEMVENPSSVDAAAFAIEFELRVNPTWPMPSAVNVLDELHRRELMLGIVSNAQFFTPLLFPALLDRSLEDFGFSCDLTYFSFEHRQAKPGTALYELAKSKLAGLGIAPDQVLYVGNDMLNDVTAASQVGFRTALFAGDERSLRLRSEDERVHGVEADIVITELKQIIECLP